MHCVPGKNNKIRDINNDNKCIIRKDMKFSLLQGRNMCSIWKGIKKIEKKNSDNNRKTKIEELSFLKSNKKKAFLHADITAMKNSPIEICNEAKSIIISLFI